MGSIVGQTISIAVTNVGAKGNTFFILDFLGRTNGAMELYGTFILQPELLIKN